MNENINLIRILKNCPKGWKFYSSIHGTVLFTEIKNTSTNCPIQFISFNKNKVEQYDSVTEQGLYSPYSNGECTFFPSKDQRDWSKFTAPWYKNENLIQNKFDPKNLIPFNKVLVRDSRLVSDSPSSWWRCQIFSFINEEDKDYPYVCIGESYSYCIPYNDDTKHLVGTNKEAPEFYKYWED